MATPGRKRVKPGTRQAPVEAVPVPSTTPVWGNHSALDELRRLTEQLRVLESQRDAVVGVLRREGKWGHGRAPDGSGMTAAGSWRAIGEAAGMSYEAARRRWSS
uniref:Uncharacterized protein n=1 Tax=uncultured prokaryote TaxID=198431 RepID=A0A0H5QJI5_9ZZZZ|nr:hypothetical protein [uncultured prokaryote]